MKKWHWLAILIGMILMIGLIGPGRAEEQLPPEIKSALAGMEINQTAYWENPGSTWFVLIREPDGMNVLLCFELQDGAWIQSFYTGTAVPQGKTGVERLFITGKLQDFVDDRVLPGPILLILTDDGSYTSYQRSASGQWNLLKVFWMDEQVHLDFDDESVTFITPIDQDNNRFETVEGSFERDLRKVDINAIPKSPQQAREMRTGKPSREYFENLDKESSLQDIVRDAGKYGIEGSGILYHVWTLNDGSRAKVMFDSDGRIVMIYIAGENGSERIYKREYQENGSDAGHAAGSESH